MKTFVALTLAALLVTAPAAAQSIPSGSACGHFTPAPASADGERASRDAMTAAGERLAAWRTTREQEQAACQAEIDAVRAQLEAMIGAYNDAGRERVAVIGAWNGEVAQYSARGGRRAQTN